MLTSVRQKKMIVMPMLTAKTALGLIIAPVMEDTLETEQSAEVF